MQELDISSVLDVGANIGQYGRRLRRGGFAGIIHSFEPGAAAYSALQDSTRSDANWFTHRCAVGATAGSAPFRMWSGEGSTVASLLQPSAALTSLLGPPTEEQVDVTTVAEWLTNHKGSDPSHSLLKLDVQGGECDVLLGAGQALSAFAMVEIELPLGKLYEGASSLSELLELLERAGFRPSCIVTERFVPHWRGAADVDALFIRSDMSRVPSS
jgi:FkbM family methyltransferase